jgi:glycosyltransferase involved in cell wall biosynthesis
MRKLKVAIIHEWFTTLGGSEFFVKNLYSIFPDADIFTLVANTTILNKLGINPAKVKTSFIQKLPFGLKKYKSYLPLFPMAIEQFNLAGYDLVISSSHAVAKGVLTSPSQIHVCYCHSPIRYAWDLYHQYLQESGLDRGIRGIVAKFFLHRIRIWDVISSNRVDYFLSNSDYIGKRIKKIYRRESRTIYSGINLEDFPLVINKDNYYFTCSRFVPYKKINLIVEAFNEMPEKMLVIIGDGPDFTKVKAIAKGNVTLMGYQPFGVLKDYMSRAKAFVFAAEEDFGLVPVEAQACGTPVIAFGKGGVTETVIENITGIFFKEQSVESLKEAVRKFDTIDFDPTIIKKRMEIFGRKRFNEEMIAFFEEVLDKKLSPNVVEEF